MATQPLENFVTTGGNQQMFPVENPSPSAPVAPVAPRPLSITGQDYVATATGGAPGSQFSPTQVVQGISNQLGTGVQTNAGQVVQGLQGQFAQPNVPGATQTVMGSLGQILSEDNPYIQNARRRGLEMAGSRGLLNSSIASGASQRAAIESSLPILGEAMGLNRQREGQDFERVQQAFQAAAQMTGQDRQNAFANAQNMLNQTLDLNRQRENLAFQAQESQLQRTQQVNNQLLESQLRAGDRIEDAQLQDWLASNAFTRQFNAQLQMIPINNAQELVSNISQMALMDPELYTPEVVSGMTEFLNRNMLAIMQQYFPGG